MRFMSARLVLVVTVFVIVVMVMYFAFIPRSFLLPHHHSKHSSFLLKASPSLSNVSSKDNTNTLPTEGSGFITTDTKASLEMAKEMQRKNGIVLFTMINDAFFEFAASWCCNTAAFKDIHQRALFLTTDLQTGQRLRSLWPNVSVVAMTSSQFQGSQVYSRAGYVRMMIERTRFIQRLLEAGVRLLLFEVDCVWLADPLPLILSHQSERDIIATKVTGKDTTAGGFLLLNPTPATVQFWQQLTHMMDQLFKKLKKRQNNVAVSETLNDQEFFSSLARKKYAGIRIMYLPSDTFPDGKWYSQSEKKRLNSRPVIINNNWVVGTDAKRQRAKAFGHWFWDESQGKCNSSAIHHIGH